MTTTTPDNCGGDDPVERRRACIDASVEVRMMGQQISTHIADEDRLFRSIRSIISVFSMVCSILASVIGWVYLDGRAQQQATNLDLRTALSEHSAQISRTLTLMEVAAEINRRQQLDIEALAARRKP